MSSADQQAAPDTTLIANDWEWPSTIDSTYAGKTITCKVYNLDTQKLPEFSFDTYTFLPNGNYTVAH